MRAPCFVELMSFSLPSSLMASWRHNFSEGWKEYIVESSAWSKTITEQNKKLGDKKSPTKGLGKHKKVVKGKGPDRS